MIVLMMMILMMMTVISNIMIIIRTSIITTMISQPSRPISDFLAFWPAAPAGGTFPNSRQRPELAPRPRFWARRKREGGRLSAPPRMT